MSGGTFGVLLPLELEELGVRSEGDRLEISFYD